jgi:hypothetical protein
MVHGIHDNLDIAHEITVLAYVLNVMRDNLSRNWIE